MGDIDWDKKYEKCVLEKFLWIWLPFYAITKLTSDVFFN